MQVNLTNINRLANMNSVNLDRVDRKLKQAVYFIEAWSENEAMRKAADEFEWNYPYYNIVKLRVELISDGYGYGRNYYKVTIIYTYNYEDPINISGPNFGLLP